MTSEAYEAVLFDFGGVLTTPVWDSFAAYCRSQGLEPDAIKQLLREDPAALAELRRLETGALTESEFERSLAGRLGISDPEGLIDAIFAGMRAEPAMVEAVRELRRAGLKTALVSNSWSVNHYDRELLAALFDQSLISGELGMHKPQPQIFELAAERLGAAPESCIFVDDLRENCRGAEAVGMTAVLHRSAAETIGLLGELTGIALAAPA